MIREDRNDKIYLTEDEKNDAIIDEIITYHEKGNPILVGTISVENSEVLSKKLDILNIPHRVLNAKQNQQEAEIISQAGKEKAVTIATNMAGRGTDIVLGGFPESETARKEVVELGGLHVIVLSDTNPEELIINLEGGQADKVIRAHLSFFCHLMTAY